MGVLSRSFYTDWLHRFKSKLRGNGGVPSGRHVRTRSSLQEASCESFGGYTVRYAWVDELASWILHERDYQRLLVATTSINRLCELGDRDNEETRARTFGGNGLSQTILDLHSLANSSLGSRILLREPFVDSRRCDSLTCNCRHVPIDVQRQRTMAILDSIQRDRSVHVVCRCKSCS